MSVRIRKDWLGYLVYAGVVLLILLPLLRPGYILTLDMVFTPWLPMPSEVTSSYLFHACLHMLSLVIPSSVLEKLLLIGILLLASIGMHKLIRQIAERHTAEWGIYIASIFFMMNPYTYSRFMAGQYAVLLGYALLPWLIRSMLGFVRRPGLAPALRLGGWLTLIGIVSIHTLAAVLILVAAGGVVGSWRHKEKLKAVAKYGLVAAGMFIGLSSYWLVPLLLGHGKTAATITQFTAADAQAFMTTGSNALERIGHSLRLQGFWAEGHQLYLLPQDGTILWGLTALIVIAFVIVGARQLWGAHRTVTLWLMVSTVAALVFASGMLTSWMAMLPLGLGMREPHKLVMLVAVTYSVFLAFGISAFLEWMYKKHEALHGPAAVFLFAMPFLYMRVMLWGFDGQLSPRQYPSDWFALRERLGQAESSGQTLFLPWHQYMTFRFAGRIIAHPSPDFYGKKAIVSNDPELGGAVGFAADARQTALDTLFGSGSPPKQTNLARELARQNIEYVVLNKEFDYKEYEYATTAPGLVELERYPTLTLYKNTAWRHP